MDQLYIIIPAYNEKATIQDVINDWYPVVEQYNGNNASRLVLIDDGSKDNTYEIMKEHAKSRPLMEVLTKPNSGHGATILFGYQYAIDKGADYIFQTDSDGQTIPEEFHDFWEMKEHYDMVIGHRNQRKDGLSRVFVTKVLKVVIRLCFGVAITDANTPFRLMKASVLANYIPLIPDQFNLSNVIISVIFAKKKCSVKYLPVTFRPRQGGVNSINLKKIFRIGRQAVKDFYILNQTINQEMTL